MKLPAKINDRDPKLTFRRILLVVNAVGEQVPTKVVDWIVATIEGGDGDIVRIKNWALAATLDKRPENVRVTPGEAVSIIRDVCVRRLSA